MKPAPDSPSPRAKRLAVLIFVSLLTGWPGQAVAQQAVAGDALRPGDGIRLTLTIPGEGGADLSGEYMIDESGTISLPILGAMQATAIPAQQLRQRIIEEYQSLYRNQAMQVTVLRRISVLGAVRTPGLYLADPTMRIGEVIALAGGVAPNGKEDKVRIVRDGREIEADLTLSSTLPTELRSGDQIFVPQTSWAVRNFPWLVGVTMGVIGLLIRGY